jgi:hypothetical protein
MPCACRLSHCSGNAATEEKSQPHKTRPSTLSLNPPESAGSLRRRNGWLLRGVRLSVYAGVAAPAAPLAAVALQG